MICFYSLVVIWLGRTLHIIRHVWSFACKLYLFAISQWKFFRTVPDFKPRRSGYESIYFVVFEWGISFNFRKAVGFRLASLPIFLIQYNSKSQTSIKRLRNCSRSKETVKTKKKKGKSFLFLFCPKWNLGRILFILCSLELESGPPDEVKMPNLTRQCMEDV